MSRNLYSIKATFRTYWVVAGTPAQALAEVDGQTRNVALVTVEEMAKADSEVFGLVAEFPGAASD